MANTWVDGTEADRALLHLLARLSDRGYDFVAVTPATHARILAQPGREEAASLRDVFGWNLPFQRGLLSRDLFAALEAAGAIETAGSLLRSRLRVARLGDALFLHSAYPTQERDAVFFGPDSYRFAALIQAELAASPLPSGSRVADIGAGTGVGALIAAAAGARPRQLLLTDINPKALRLARINAAAAGMGVELLEADGLGPAAGPFDLILINPPYLIDAEERAYRDGGGLRGGALGLRLAREALPRLAPHGRLLLYTGSAIVAGQDQLGQLLRAAAAEAACRICYREIDPDVFGEELSSAAYAGVERIALVAATFTRSPEPPKERG